MPRHFTRSELESLPTICSSQSCDLKLETANTRIWLSRCSVLDGEPFPRKVTVERLKEGRWIETETYEAH